MAGNLAPNPLFPERGQNVYEEKYGQNVQRRGPLRFEEGVATDTDVPSDFQVGVLQGYQTPAGRPNHNQNVYEKWPEETMRQRAHVGSAAWVEGPTFTSQFAEGAGHGDELKYRMDVRSGGRYGRINPAEVPD